MSFLPARKGRHRQRNEDHLRLVAGLKKNVEDRNGNVTSRITVLMISMSNRDDLVFPKGGWEDDEAVYEAACPEVLEEAGVKGILDLSPEEAYKFCRYDWMIDALQVFLTAIEKDRMSGRAEKLVELPMFPVPDALVKHQMLSAGCSGKPSSTQQLEESFTNKCIVQG